MQIDNSYINELKQRIIELNPFLIVLFGSYAYGNPHKDSDIDLLVVTNDNNFPENYDERIKLQLVVSNYIFDILKKVPVDLLVYTVPMYKKFIEQSSLFAQEILTKGVILYERNNTAVA